MSNQAEFERSLAALIVEFSGLGVPGQQIREALLAHASIILDDVEMPRQEVLRPELDYNFRKRIRAVVSPDDKDLAAEVEAAIGTQLDDIAARCGLSRCPCVT